MKKLFSLLFVALLAMTAWGADVTLDFSTNDAWQLPTSKTVAAAQYTNGTYTITVAGSTGNGYYWMNQYKALLMGKQGAYLTLPAFSQPVERIEVTGTSGASTAVKQNIFVNGTAVSTETTGAKDVTNVYEIDENYQTAGTVYSLQVTSAHNTHVSKIEVFFVQGAEPALVAPVFNPAGCEFDVTSLAVTVSCATPNASIYLFQVLEDENGEYEQYVDQFFPDNDGKVSGEFYVTESGKYGAYAYKGTDYTENVYATYTKVLPVCATPTFTPASGATFEDTETVRIDCATEGATIMYQVNNGDVEMDEAPVYIELTQTSTITAFASCDGYQDSPEVTATFTKVEPFDGYTYEFFPTTDTIPGYETPGATQGKLTVTKERVTFVISNGRYSNYTQGTTEYHEYRIFKSATINFSTTYGKIVKIEFIGSDVSPDNSPNSAFGNTQGLTYSADGMIGTWTGNAINVSFTATGIQCRLSEIIVYVEGDEPNITVAEPVFDPGTTGFTGTQVVTLSCETEGASIYYSINDAEYQLYTAAFTVTEDSTVVKAYAELQGVQSGIVTAKYYKRAEVTTLADANKLQNRKDFVFYGNVVVVYQNGSYLYVKDDTDCGLIYGSDVPTFAEGTTLDEEWTAQYQLYRGHINEYAYPADLAATDAELVEIVPTEYTEAEITTDKINERVIVKGLTLTAGTDAKYYYTANGMAIYNQFGITYPTLEEGKTYDVEGMVSYYNDAVQIMPIAITEAQAAGLLGDVTGDGQVNITDVTALISAVLNDAFDSIIVANADLTGEGDINISDITALISLVLNN